MRDIFKNIEKPTLLLNRERVLRNIKRMAEKAKKSGVFFRPHFKTHQSAEIGNWFREFGVEGITVSSVSMAQYFFKNGWKDITIAFPVNSLEIEKINRIAESASLGLLVLSKEVVKILNKSLRNKVNIWIKIDVSSKRTGIPWNDYESILEVAKEVDESGNLELQGILTHAGHSYQVKSKEKIAEVYKDSVERMNYVAKFLEEKISKRIRISVGDTPTCSVMEKFDGVDEIRPGNFVFYDIMQLELLSCKEEDIAVGVACPVVAKHSERNEIILYCGAVHLSKDFILNERGEKVFGYIAFPEKHGWGSIIKSSYLSTLSQEHGILKTEAETFKKINVGDIIVVLPVHSCLTVDAMRRFLTFDGKFIDCGSFKS
ncbi:MAG: alanine racemase [Candidatus Aminicenantia bacterium]